MESFPATNLILEAETVVVPLAVLVALACAVRLVLELGTTHLGSIL